MLNAKDIIISKNLFNKGDIIGVACSGGADSMALLHYLNAHKEEFDIEVIAININHNIRQDSEKDSIMVANYCKEMHIKCYKFNLDVFKVMEENGQTLEEAARTARYTMFDSLLARGIIDKIALGHHMADQMETVLLNLFRGTGLLGAGGMNYSRGKYVRPFLNTSKNEILAYVMQNEIPYVDDETNFECDANRNYIRNKIIPLIKSRWPNVENNIFSFANICREDDAYIRKQAYLDGIIRDKDIVKIPLTYFLYSDSIVTRVIQYSLEYLGVQKDFEKKHFALIKNLTKLENGSKINLPNNTTAHKEYDFLTLCKKRIVINNQSWQFKCGKTKIDNFGTIVISRAKEKSVPVDALILDGKKLPKNAEWRYKRDGDTFEKFGGGTKKLKSVLTDKKIPSRMRKTLPVLASGHEVYVIAGVDISNKVKVDNKTSVAYIINVINN